MDGWRKMGGWVGGVGEKGRTSGTRNKGREREECKHGKKKGQSVKREGERKA